MFTIVSGVIDYFKGKSVLALILANLLPLYGVYYLGWSISQIVVLYWFENVIIGFYNVLKMLYNSNENIGQESLAALKVFFIPFFIMHYGMFTFVHGVFVFIYFVFSITNGNGMSWNDFGYLLLNAFLIFVSHGISFMVNYIGNDEKSRTNINMLMFSPYVRIIAMQLVVIFGGMIYLSTEKNDASLYILIIFKIIADIWSHTAQHIKWSKITVAKA